MSRGLETCDKTGASVFRPRSALDIHARSPAETGSGRAYGYLSTRFPRLGPPAGERYGCTPSGLTISSADCQTSGNFVRSDDGWYFGTGAATSALHAMRLRPASPERPRANSWMREGRVTYPVKCHRRMPPAETWSMTQPHQPMSDPLDRLGDTMNIVVAGPTR